MAGNSPREVRAPRSGAASDSGRLTAALGRTPGAPLRAGTAAWDDTTRAAEADLGQEHHRSFGPPENSSGVGAQRGGDGRYRSGEGRSPGRPG